MTELAQHLLSPAILAFLIGFGARLVKSDLKIPEAVYSFLSIYLLFAIGFKGAYSLKAQDFSSIQGLLLLGISLCIAHAFLSYLLSRFVFKREASQAAAITAHFASVSAVTYMTASQFLEQQNLHTPGYFSALVALMEIPGLILAIYFYERHNKKNKSSFKTLFSILNGKSVILLLGGFLIGWFAKETEVMTLKKVFIDLFQGCLILFLIEMGGLVANRFSEQRGLTAKLLGMSVVLSIANAFLSYFIAQQFTSRVEDVFIFTILGASASYIAAPVAVQTSMPKSDLSEALTMSLGLIFPINLILGIPFYFFLASLN